jgi:DNA-binding NarL/FixJ family response regulator
LVQLFVGCTSKGFTFTLESGITEGRRVTTTRRDEGDGGKLTTEGRTRSDPTAVIAVHTPRLLVSLSEVLADADVRIVGTAYDADAAARVAELLQPDVLISEFSLARRSLDLALVERVRELAPRVRFVAILNGQEPQLVDDVVGAGADAYAWVETAPEDLAVAIRQLFRQVIFIADDCMYGGDDEPVPLTRRETLILRLVADGYTNQEVAAQLEVSEQTVKFHLTNVFRKLDVANRTEASSWARESGLTLLAAAGLEDRAEAVGASG